MRLISQDGLIDVPYESTNVSISYKEKNKIIAWGFGCEEHHIIDLGTYSSNEKAKKVMEMLRSQYQRIWEIENGFITQGIINNHIFVFPKDEEVEV